MLLGFVKEIGYSDLIPRKLVDTEFLSGIL